MIDGGDDSDNQPRAVEVTENPPDSDFNKVKKGTNGPDEIKGNGKDDKIEGKNNNDLIKGKGGNDRLLGDSNRDTLIGGKGSDVLSGGQGHDVLEGGGGNDILFGGHKGDTMTGNGGKDVFVLSAGKDIVTDFELNKDFIGIVYPLDLKFKQNGDDMKVTGNDNVKTLFLNVNKDDFLANYPNNLQEVPAVEVDLI